MEFFKTTKAKHKGNLTTITDDKLPLWKRVVGIVKMMILMFSKK